MLRMDQVHVIRHKVLVEGLSIRSVAKQLGLSRNTVRKYLSQSEPIRKEKGPRARPVLDAVAPVIDGILDDWKRQTTSKQRFTGTRLHEELISRGHHAGISTVRAYLAERRRVPQRCSSRCTMRPGIVPRWTSSRW
jgi:predicted transcriptional regulator